MLFKYSESYFWYANIHQLPQAKFFIANQHSHSLTVMFSFYVGVGK